jgi:hypothetical protein
MNKNTRLSEREPAKKGKRNASVGSRTRANCLEGNYPTVGPRKLLPVILSGILPKRELRLGNIIGNCLLLTLGPPSRLGKSQRKVRKNITAKTKTEVSRKAPHE